MEHFRNQNYHKLKKQHQKAGTLFIDPEFPAAQTSLYLDPSREATGGVEWKRPGEIAGNPRLFVDGVSVDDVTQGILGNCWFVSACSVLTHHIALLDQVIPDAEEQDWSTDHPERYCGIFRFAFYRFGQWTEVVVDDLLPVREGDLIFAHSKTKNEFWSALLEKAFAKMSGCYESLIGGALNEALMDLSGGIPETLDLTSDKYQLDPASSQQLFQQIKEAVKNKSLIACAIKVATLHRP